MDSSPYHSSVADSTSKLFAGLDLIEADIPAQIMDEMESDFALVIPDTPDRISSMHKEEKTRNGGNQSSPSRLLRRTNSCDRSNLSSSTEESNRNVLDHESLFRRARLAGLLEVKDHGQKTLRAQKKRGENSVTYREQKGFSDLGLRDKGGKAIDTGSRIPMDISYPTRCRTSLRNNGKGFHDEGPSHSSSQCDGTILSQCQLTRRTRSGTHLGSKLPRFDAGQDIHDDGCSYSLSELDKTGSASSAAGVGLNADSNPNSKCIKSPSKISEFDTSPMIPRQRRLVRNGCISPSNIAKGVTSVCEGNVDLFAEGSVTGKVDESQLPSVSTRKSLEVVPELAQSNHSRNIGLKGLLQHGFVSRPERLKDGIIEIENDDGIGETTQHEAPHGKSASVTSNTICPDSINHRHGESKGKGILDESSHTNDRCTGPRSSSSRFGIFSSTRSALTGEAIKDRFSMGGVGWRKPRSHRVKSSNSVLEIKDELGLSVDHTRETTSGERGDIDLVCGTPQPNHTEASASVHQTSIPSPFEISSDTTSKLIVEDDRNHTSQNLLKGKRKSRSTHSQHGESSIASINKSLIFPSVGQNSNATNFSWRKTSQPVIDVDELSSPESRPSGSGTGDCLFSDDPNGRDLQLVSDELLARQLQDQLLNESPGFASIEEIDASIAWTLQQEEDARQVSAGNRRSERRDASVAHLYRHYPQHPLPRVSGRSANYARGSSRLTQLRRSLNRRHMDLESRLNYLEALEAAFNDSSHTTISNQLLHIQRDFNENDYEMLLTLDSDDHQNAGATSHQINSLPLSVVQNEDSEESCAVCLETPSIGDTMRHLPCLHKFHKDCIDAWLRRKTSCPICKSGIT